MEFVWNGSGEGEQMFPDYTQVSDVDPQRGETNSLETVLNDTNGSVKMRVDIIIATKGNHGDGRRGSRLAIL